MEALLRSWDNLILPTEQVRALRAVEVLERAGTPQARQVLQRLAAGTAEARLTRAARAVASGIAEMPDADDVLRRLVQSTR